MISLGHAVELGVEEVLDIHFLEGQEITFVGGTCEHLFADEDVDLAEEARVEEVGDLNDEEEEGLDVDGELAAQQYLAGVA